MTQIIDSASLHPKTVANHQKFLLVKTRARGSRSGPVQRTKVDARVWDAAVRLCGEDYGRLVIVNKTCVIVKNNSQ